MRPEGQVSRKGGGANFGCLRLNCAANLQLGGDFERVNVSHLGGSGGMPPGKYLILSPLKWLEMHLKLTWCGETCGERVV